MNTITLRQALGVLAKSSRFSVKTVTARVRDIFDDLKEYLYVEQDIELDFKQRLTSLRPGERYSPSQSRASVVFLATSMLDDSLFQLTD